MILKSRRGSESYRGLEMLFSQGGKSLEQFFERIALGKAGQYGPERDPRASHYDLAPGNFGALRQVIAIIFHNNEFTAKPPQRVAAQKMTLF